MPFSSQALEQKDWPTYLSASRTIPQQHTDTSRSGWHPHPSVLYSLSPISVFPLPVSILLLWSQLSPISRAHRSQINLFDSQIFNPDVKCIAWEVGGTAKTDKKGRVWKGPRGAESMPGIWSYWSSGFTVGGGGGWGVKGHQAGSSTKAGQNEAGCQHPWITVEIICLCSIIE